MPTLVLDLESSSTYSYLAVVERLLDQLGIILMGQPLSEVHTLSLAQRSKSWVIWPKWLPKLGHHELWIYSKWSMIIDHWPKKIYRPKMIVWWPVLYSSQMILFCIAVARLYAFSCHWASPTLSSTPNLTSETLSNIYVRNSMVLNVVFLFYQWYSLHHLDLLVAQKLIKP